MDNLVLLNRKIRNLILDYALGASIIALFPLPGHWGWGIGKAIALLVLNYTLIQQIRRVWQGGAKGDFLAMVGSVLGATSAVLLSLAGWGMMMALSLIIPRIYVLADGVAAFIYFWVIGQTVHHFYLSGVGGGQQSSPEEKVQDEA